MSESVTCPACKTVYKGEFPSVCDKCYYPFAGTEQEKAKFVSRFVMNKGKLGDTKNNLRNSRIILIIIAAINLGAGIFFLATASGSQDTATDGIASLLIAIIFIVCTFTINKWPVVSIIIPLCILLLSYMVLAIMEPTNILNGIIWKILIITVLTTSLINVVKSEKIKRQSSYMSEKGYI